MISIEKYKLLRDKGSISKYRVKSEETSICPVCGSPKLKIIGSRDRKVFMSSGKTIILVIRRLRCSGCNRVHHELPDLIVPYKRYSSDSIEAIVDGAEKEVSCENSSIYRIKRWFKETSGYIAGCIAAIAAQRGLATDAASYPVLQSIKSYVGKDQGWLARAVRTMVNTNNWVHTRSAFMA